MKLPFGSRLRQLAWTYAAGGLIWRLMPAEGGFLVGEDRDTGAKRASFFSIGREGRVLWSGLSPGDQWWIGMEAVHEGILFLHEFASPSMPEHSKIIAVDVEGGAILWRNDELRWVCGRPGRVWASRPLVDHAEIVELDARTGARVRQVSPDEVQGLDPFTLPSSVEFPQPGGQAPESVINAALKGARNPVQVEILELPDATAVAYYDQLSADPAAPRYIQRLVVVDQQRAAVIYRDTVMANALHPAPDTFFAWDGTLYYIRERKELCALSLTAPVRAHGHH